jgi:hypothetical protein
MKKTIFVISLALAVVFVLGTPTVQSQPGRGGYGMGPGMMRGYGGSGMGPGMMGGYGPGYGMGRGYGRQSQSTGKSIDAKEAGAMMKDYLKSMSLSENPFHAAGSKCSTFSLSISMTCSGDFVRTISLNWTR